VILTLAPAAQRGLLAQQGWGQSPQYQVPQYSSQPYAQANPNYTTYPQGQQPVYPAQQGYPQQPQYPQDQQYAQQPPYDGGQAGYAPVQQGPQPFAAEQLEQLVAPIALYPDSLVAQVLAASTYPAQVIAADNWLHSLGYAPPEQVAAGANAQTNWDPSVKALTAFPQVLDLMNRDLHWTTDLGNAYYNQPQDVLQTIQVMRQRAEDAGTLRSTPQEAVYYQQGYIQLAPPNPEVVYVPSYNPWDVYGQPVSPYPGFSLIGALESFAGSSPVQYGLGLAMSAFSNTPFGWAGWALNWLTSSVLFHQSPYASQSTSVQRFGGSFGGGDGGYYGGRNGGGINRQPNGYPRTEQGFNRLGNGQPGFTRPPVRTAQNFTDNRGGEMSGRGNFGSYVRPALPGYTYNRPAPILPARPQTYSRPGGYGSGFDGRGGQSFARPASPYSYGGQQGWRTPESTYQRNDFAQRSYAEPRSYSGNRGYAEAYARPEKSGGMHLFGGGHSGGDEHFAYKAPKMPKPMKAPHMSGGGGFGGGHHGGGGGFGGGHHGGGGGLFGHGFGHR